MKTKRYKYSFTLLEMLISMALLSVISSCFVYKGWDLLCEHRFLSSARRIQSEITSAKLNALTYQIDLTLKFSEKGSGSLLLIETGDPPKALSQVVGKTILLPNVKLNQDVIFYSNGHHSPDGSLVLTPVKGKTKPRCVSLSQIDRMKVI